MLTEAAFLDPYAALRSHMAVPRGQGQRWGCFSPHLLGQRRARCNMNETDTVRAKLVGYILNALRSLNST